MTEHETALAKQHMLEVKRFQKWIADTREGDYKKNPDWQKAVTDVMHHVASFISIKSPNIRQELEALMTEHVEGVSKNRAETDGEILAGPEKDNHLEVTSSGTVTTSGIPFVYPYGSNY